MSNDESRPKHHRQGLGRGNRSKDSRNLHSSNDSNHNVILSKSLSYLLRHGAPKEDVTIHPGGFINVDEILRLQKFLRWSVEDVRKVVEDNDKQRFTLRNDPVNGLQICANQGHSFDVVDLELETISSAEKFPLVIHGTYLRHWNSIKKSGLSRMSRIHMHFAPGEPGEAGVISGMRGSAEIYIYINIATALKDGINFYRSRNNVILCPGNEDGVLETKYFAKVVNVKTGEVLNW